MNWNFFKTKKKSPIGYAESDNDAAWLSYFNQYMQNANGGKLIKFDQSNAYELANTIAEIFIPIDAIAERCSSLKYDIVDTNTKEVITPQGNLKRLLDSPNPLDRFSDIIYQSIFAELADGNSYIYTKTADSIVNPTYDNISNIWVLKPNVTKPVLHKEISNPFLMKQVSDLVDYYKTFFFYEHRIKPRYVLHTANLGITQTGTGRSPLFACEKNINNILAVYQARYNVYAKNGNAGILAKAPVGGGGASLQEAIDPVTRDTMLKDLQDRNGLVGDKNFIGMSSVPLQFIKTLGTIKELEPFDETLENAIKIAGVFGVNKELLPKKDNATFSNQTIAEKSFWQNVIKAFAYDTAKSLNKIYYLPDNWTFMPNFTGIEALQEDKKAGLEADGLFIDNLDKLKANGIDVEKAYLTIQERYNGK
jgi:phage portal protein BeeE